MAVPGSPLTQEDLAEMKNRLLQLDEAERQAKLAQQAGLDVKDQMAQIRDLRDKIQKLRQTYFPGE